MISHFLLQKKYSTTQISLHDHPKVKNNTLEQKNDDLIDFFVVLSRKHSSSSRRVKIMADNLRRRD